MKRIFEAVLFSFFLVELSQFTSVLIVCLCLWEFKSEKNKASNRTHTALAVIRILPLFFIPFSSFSLGFLFSFFLQKDNSARHFDWPLSSRRSVRLQKGNKK